MCEIYHHMFQMPPKASKKKRDIESQNESGSKKKRLESHLIPNIPIDNLNTIRSAQPASNNQQVYGVPNFDALMEHVLDDDKIRSSFLNTFAPHFHITHS